MKTPKGTEKAKFSENVIALSLAEKHGNALKYDSISGEWRSYKLGIWENSKEINVRQSIQIAMNRDFTRDFSFHFVAGVQKLLMGYVPHTKWDDDVSSLIPFKNGVLNLKTREFSKHSPENFLTWQLPYEYSTEATCEPILTWLKAACGGDAKTVELIRAFFNSAVTGRANLQRFFEIDGPAGSGKGTLTRLLNAMIGDRNVYTTTLKQLEENRFEPAALEGKRLVQINDAEKFGGEGSVLKSLIGQDKMRKEKKNKQQTDSFFFKGMLLIIANEPVTFADGQSGAIPRRRVSIRFDNVVQVDEWRDLSVEFKPYIPGLLNWSLGIDDVEVDNLIKNSEKNVSAAKLAKKETLIQTNNLVAWLNSNIELAPGNKVKVGSLAIGTDSDGRTLDKFKEADNWLYPNYVRFCLETSKKHINQIEFSSKLEDVLKNTLRLGEQFKKRSGRVDANSTGAHFVGLKICKETENSIIDYAFSERAESVPVTMPEKVMKAAMAVIYEQCRYDLNSNEKVDVESKLSRAFANKDVFDVAEEFGKNFQVATKAGKSPADAWSIAMDWLESFLRGEMPF